MKQRRRIISTLLAALLVLGMMPTAWAAPQDKQVTLRIEFAESTLQQPVTMDVQAKTFADYGLTDVTDPGYVTPLHVLAAYMEQTMGATADRGIALACYNASAVIGGRYRHKIVYAAAAVLLDPQRIAAGA